MPAPGDTFAGFRLRRVLGQGASGTVFVAQREKDAHWVALKVLRRTGTISAEDQAEVDSRFSAEHAIARRLSHPGIVKVIDAGREGDASWLAMELVPGCSLERYTRPPRLLPPDVVLDIVEPIASALAHAHQAGVLHRDIKPSNILVDVPARLVKLSDFGASKVADSAVTRTGMMLGTPSYMAPEALAGLPADARADLYALGVILFELLTGHRPHEAASMGELLRAIASQSAPDLRQFWPQAPAVLAELQARLLAPRPDDRFADAGQLCTALDRARVHIGGASQHAAHPGSMDD